MDDFAVFELRGALLALFPLGKLARDSRTHADKGHNGIRFSIIISVDDSRDLDELTDRVRAAGGRFTKDPVDADFHSGRSAYFADPEDNYWGDRLVRNTEPCDRSGEARGRSHGRMTRRSTRIHRVHHVGWWGGFLSVLSWWWLGHRHRRRGLVVDTPEA